MSRLSEVTFCSRQFWLFQETDTPVVLLSGMRAPEKRVVLAQKVVESHSAACLGVVPSEPVPPPQPVKSTGNSNALTFKGEQGMQDSTKQGWCGLQPQG